MKVILDEAASAAGVLSFRRRVAALEGELELERQRRLAFQRSLGLPLHDDALLERELWARAYQGDDEAAEILSGLYAAGLERMTEQPRLR